MAQKSSIDLQSLEILPLEKQMVKGAFLIKDDEHEHLINWFRTRSVVCQRERKSKTYVAYHNDQAIAFVAISAGLLQNDIDGVPNTTDHQTQVLTLGKLYVIPDLRGNGIGSKVLSFVLDIAINLNEMVGCVGIILDANNNKETIEFYKKFGFVEIDTDRQNRTVQMFFKLPD